MAAAYCEDHLPHDADILQICPRFQYLGQLHPRPVRPRPPVAACLALLCCKSCFLHVAFCLALPASYDRVWHAWRCCAVKACAAAHGMSSRLSPLARLRAICMLHTHQRPSQSLPWVCRRASCTAARTAARSPRACRTCSTRLRSSRSSARPRPRGARKRWLPRRLLMRQRRRPRLQRRRPRRLGERCAPRIVLCLS